MKYLIKGVATIYRMYDDRGLSIPHFRALITVLLILFLHSLHIGLLFRIPLKWLIPWKIEDSKLDQWLSGFLFFGVFTLIAIVILKKRRLEKIEISQNQIDRARIIVPIYLVLCILLLAILLIKSGIERGFIEF